MFRSAIAGAVILKTASCALRASIRELEHPRCIRAYGYVNGTASHGAIRCKGARASSSMGLCDAPFTVTEPRLLCSTHRCLTLAQNSLLGASEGKADLSSIERCCRLARLRWQEPRPRESAFCHVLPAGRTPIPVDNSGSSPWHTIELHFAGDLHRYDASLLL